MGYIEFDKTQLINLEYALSKEFIRSNKTGSFAGNTIINCNTRKYHGLLICPIDQIDGENHLLLSALDETIIQHDKEFHLAVRKYPGLFHPGHKYLRELNTNPIPTLTYRVGEVILQKETLLAQEEDQVLLRYTLVDASSPSLLRLHPFLTFRNIHQLNKASLAVNTKYEPAKNGIKTRMYDNYPDLYLQCSKKNEYIHAPDWFYNVEYSEEDKRGYDCLEDLFVPGYFDITLKKGESVIFSAGLIEADTSKLKQKFTAEIKKRTPRNTFENCLANSAQQFIVRRNNKTEIIAGFPWYGPILRDTFIALPGLTLTQNDTETAKEIFNAADQHLKDGLFKLSASPNEEEYSSADTPLWYIWALQHFAEHTGNYKEVWKEYGKNIISILENFKKGTQYNISMHDNGLIWAGEHGQALTWMNAHSNGWPVTPRAGYVVEINALWYNAVVFFIELAEKAGQKAKANDWKELPEQIKASFLSYFWSEEKGSLADYYGDAGQNWEVRPNQILAASLNNTMLDIDQRKTLLDLVAGELLTPRGLRTLSPNDKNYKGLYAGNEQEREEAIHQGIVWPWLLGHFADAYLKVHKMSGLQRIKDLYLGFEEEMTNAGIGTVSEIYNGNPPHEAKGAVSHAISVAELIRIGSILEKFEENS